MFQLLDEQKIKLDRLIEKVDFKNS